MDQKELRKAVGKVVRGLPKPAPPPPQEKPLVACLECGKKFPSSYLRDCCSYQCWDKFEGRTK